MLDHCRKLGGWSRDEAAAACGVSVRVWNDYEAGRRPAPRHVYTLARALMLGELGSISPAWSGWQLRRGLLISPEGVALTPGDLAAWHWDRQRLAELQRRIRELSAPGYQAALF